MKKIDMHVHVTLFPDIVPTVPVNGTRLLNTEEQLQIHDKLDVEYGVILPLINPTAQYMLISNEEACTVARQHPDRFVWFCNVDPQMAEYSPTAHLDHIISHYKALGAKGLGELTTTLYADSPMMDNLFSSCEALEMPVLFHISPEVGNSYGIIDDPGLPRIERMLKKHKDLKYIGHSAAFWSEIGTEYDPRGRNGYPTGKVTEGRLPKLMREYGNLHCDLSAGSGSNAMMRDPEFAAGFLTEFADRIFYGCDICSTNNTFQYTFNDFLTKLVTDGMISRDVYEKIIRKNAAKLLGLPE